MPFEIPHKISYTYIEIYDFYTALKFLELLHLRAHTFFCNAPLPGAFKCLLLYLTQCSLVMPDGDIDHLGQYPFNSLRPGDAYMRQ